TSDTISISSPLPEINIIPLNVTTLCPGETAMLSTDYFSCGDPSFLWSTGSTTPNILIDTSGTYTVIITDPYGNSDTASTTVTVIQDQPVVPFISLIDDSILFSSSPVNNQWFLNGVLIPGATGQSYIPQQSGIYQVQITDVYGCTAISPPFDFIATGVQNISFENYFGIYPNPSSGKITLTFSASEKTEIQIANTLGQVVFSEKINSAREEIDVSEFPAGMYVVSAQTSSQKIERKFLKQ
ncbi:MAG TPA: T9SS type A sorting domain-containing protein, partial [Chitinophagales bacterium]|nr:T9SS type A sorting domain-containing protein [Chitinophagales bacterium]